MKVLWATFMCCMAIATAAEEKDQESVPLELQDNFLPTGMMIALKGGRHGKLCADEGNKIICNRNKVGG